MVSLSAAGAVGYPGRSAHSLNHHINSPSHLSRRTDEAGCPGRSARSFITRSIRQPPLQCANALISELTFPGGRGGKVPRKVSTFLSSSAGSKSPTTLSSKAPESGWLQECAECVLVVVCMCTSVWAVVVCMCTSVHERAVVRMCTSVHKCVCLWLYACALVCGLRACLWLHECTQREASGGKRATHLHICRCVIKRTALQLTECYVRQTDRCVCKSARKFTCLHMHAFACACTPVWKSDLNAFWQPSRVTASSSS